MQGGHFDDEGKEVVDEGVERSVDQRPPGQMGHTFVFVVQEQLGSHHDEPYTIMK